MGFKFEKQIDQTTFDESAAAWRQQLANNPDNTSETYYEGVLNNCLGAVTGDTFAGGKGSLCGVIDKETGIAAAFIICTYIKNKHVKMLNAYVAPALNVANNEPKVDDLAWIAACSIVGCLELTYKDYPCNQLKVLTNWPLDREFMTAVTTALMVNKEFGALYEVSYHGNWIVLTTL